MANKDFQNLSTQASGSITKVTPFQIKSNDGLGSLAIDLEAFRGQIADIIGGGLNYKEDLSVGGYSNVGLTKLKNHIDAASGSALNIKQGLIVTGSAFLGSALSVAGTTTLNGNVTLGDVNTDVVTINSQVTGSLFSIGGGAINNTPIGETGQSSGKFTTISGSSDLLVQGNSRLQGNLIVTGSTTIAGSTIITGDLTVNGTTTTINSTIVTVDDIAVVLGATASPSDATANGGGLILSGTKDHTILWESASNSWKFSENVIPSAGGSLDLGLSGAQWKNLFAATGSFAAGGEAINIDPQNKKLWGTNLILSTSIGDLVLDDKWRGATTTSGGTAGIKLSNASTEWTTFNSNFGSQNSILGALNQIGSNTSNPRKLTYNISASYASGTSVPVNLGLFAGGTSFDAAAMTDKNALVFYNGQLLGSGSTAQVQALPAQADYSVNAGLNNFRFGFPVSAGDIVVIKLD